MAGVLKGRPVLNFPQPPGVTMAQWQSGTGMVTDAFKPDETPGASGSAGMGVASQSTPNDATPASASGSGAGGIDTSLGGLY
jgi:penicillin-binding protein 1A